MPQFTVCSLALLPLMKVPSSWVGHSGPLRVAACLPLHYPIMD